MGCIDMKVLIIEDEPAVVESISLTFDLRWDGVECLSALQGEEGLKLARKESPDLIILDLGLPDIDGLSVLRQLRSFSRVPVIILTVRDNEMDKVTGLELGADDYITKPFSVHEFLSRVKTVLRRSQMPGSQIDEKVFAAGSLRINFANREASIAGKPLNLNPEGYKLLVETMAQQNHDSNGYALAKIEEAPLIGDERHSGRVAVVLKHWVQHVKSFRRSSLDKIRRYLGIGRRQKHSLNE